MFTDNETKGQFQKKEAQAGALLDISAPLTTAQQQLDNKYL